MKNSPQTPKIENRPFCKKTVGFLLLKYCSKYVILILVIYLKIIFVRHGDPDYENDSLTEKGKREAEILKNRMAKIKIDEIYCSPMGRAIRTAEPTLELLNREAEILPWLKEFHGVLADPLLKRDVKLWDILPSVWTNTENAFDKDKWIKTPLAENSSASYMYNDVIKKLDEFLSCHGYKRNGNLYDAENPNDDTIVFFCHFGITAVMLSHLLGVSPLVMMQNFVAFPSSLTVIQTEERENGKAIFRCRALGDLSHLYEAGEKPSYSGSYCELFTNENERH
ncbi:MAG: histidine phosphatase family protein [Clostridia bacterium]|nr:histidine phosphatase family protein [Clostridia bacterium]